MKTTPRYRLAVAALSLGVGLGGCAALIGADDPQAAPAPDAGQRPSLHDSGTDASLHEGAVVLHGVSLEIDPPSWSADVAGAAQTFVVLNHGSATSPQLRASLVGSGGFEIQGSTCMAPLAPGDSCTVTVVLRRLPVGGSGAAALLDVGGDGANGYATLSLPSQYLQFTPSSLMLDAPTGPPRPPTPSTLTLTNIGPFALPAPTFQIEPASSGFYLSGPTTCGALEPGGSCEVSLEFEPFGSTSTSLLVATSLGDGDAVPWAMASATLTGQSTAPGPSDGGGGGPIEASAGRDTSTPPTTEAASPPPPPGAGALLFRGPGLSVRGVTADGLFTVVSAPFAPNPFELIVLPRSGGTAQTFGLPGGLPLVFIVQGNAAFGWGQDALLTSTPGPLVVWTENSAGPVTASTNAVGEFAVTQGSYLYYFEAGADGASGADLVQSPLSDLASHTVIATGIYAGASTAVCFPNLPLATPAGLYLSTCASPTGPTTIWRFDDSGAATLIAAGVGATWGVDAAGDRVFVATAAGEGQVLDASGSLVATLDTNVTGGEMLPNGSGAVYISDEGLVTASLDAGAKQVLDPVGRSLWMGGINASGTTVLYATSTFGQLPGVPTPVNNLLATTLAAPSPIAVSAPAMALGCTPMFWTSDGAGIVWLDGTSMQAYGMDLPPVATTLTQLGSGSTLPGAGSVVLFTSGADPAINMANIAGPGPTRVIVPNANDGFALDPTGQILIYSSDAVSPSGVYSLPVGL